LPPINTIQVGITETTTNKEEEQEQEQQSRAWNSCCWMDRTPEACFDDTALHRYLNVTEDVCSHDTTYHLVEGEGDEGSGQAAPHTA
jgi:hypothetical protein